MACYYRKTASGAPPAPHFVAGVTGFRRWSQVARGREPSVGLDAHPHVYISHGRHNCNFRPGTANVPLETPWGDFSANGIEGGKYSSAPAENTLEGRAGDVDLPAWVYIPFADILPYVLCANGCEPPVQFDGAGVPPPGYQDGVDRTDPGGYEAQPAAKGGSYPKKAAGTGGGPPKKLSVRIRYVDLSDPDTDARWGYPGTWGAATKVDAPDQSTDAIHTWGWNLGVRRPNLAAWFMWNLFIDNAVGCGGTAAPTKLP